MKHHKIKKQIPNPKIQCELTNKSELHQKWEKAIKNNNKKKIQEKFLLTEKCQ
jgi:hypothetical protein